MTEHLNAISQRQRIALPKNRYELIAWLYQKLGVTAIFIAMLAVVWWQAEKRNDETRDLVKANVAAFQQVSADLQAQRSQTSESNTRMRESVSTIMDELREIRRRDAATASASDQR